MEEKAAESFLNALSVIIRNGRDNFPESLELPRLEPVGFGLGGDEADPRCATLNTDMLFIATGSRCSAAHRHAEGRRRPTKLIVNVFTT
jgi:hypothetical protein